MGLFRPSRERRGPDPYYHWKAILFAIGAGFGLAAMVTNHDWLIWVAVPVLAVGVALRWLPRDGEDGEPEADEEAEDAGPTSPGGDDRPTTSPPDTAQPSEIPPPT